MPIPALASLFPHFRAKCFLSLRASVIAVVLAGLAPARAVELQVSPFRREATPATEMIALGGDLLKVERRSVKCDLREMAGLSTRRLANCGSAQAMSVIGQPNSDFVQFRIDPNDPMISEGTRAELRDNYETVNGEESWYRFASSLPADFPANFPHSVVLAQWHERLAGGESFRPPLSHRFVNGEFVVSLWNGEIYDKQMGADDGETIFRDPDYKRGAIYEFVYKIVWKTRGNGEVVAWRRERCSLLSAGCSDSPWQRIIDYHGSIGYRAAAGYYFKYGLYTTHKFTDPFVAYDFGFQRGRSAAAVGATDAVFEPHERRLTLCASADLTMEDYKFR